ncbi:DUF3159 domain-containing protein [Schumannella luteola]|uniref:DUF3159 domain-containing protein n=1 Tax=Schumannella luteola TaxID=472059 RepID=A0A852YDK5_9MICO|nr:DUF3159 domain-containing protein [Schumannella luteola]NYG99882.1 hypothetical protein [Schumannella luteola]TPX02188.1 DUF3159 domain-containing protein [Schumannella luteola]
MSDERDDTASAPADAERPPTFQEAMAQAARRSGLGHVKPGEAPTAGALLGAMGGIRGLIESILPGIGFLVTYTITQQLLPSVIAPAVLAVLLIVARVIQRQPVMTAVAGLLGIVISAGLALWTGNASNNFLPGFFINGGTALLVIITILVRRPIVGLIAGFLTGDADWPKDRAKLRVATIASIFWAALSLLRLGVQLPLYLADATQALGATKLIMGVPFYAALLWVTWLMMRAAWTRPAEDEKPASDV